MKCINHGNDVTKCEPCRQGHEHAKKTCNEQGHVWVQVARNMMLGTVSHSCRRCGAWMEG